MTPAETKHFLSLCEVVTLHAFGKAMDGNEYTSLWKGDEPEHLKKRFEKSFRAVMEVAAAGRIEGIGKHGNSSVPEDIQKIVFSREWAGVFVALNYLRPDDTLDNILSSDWDAWDDVKFRADGVELWLGIARSTAMDLKDEPYIRLVKIAREWAKKPDALDDEQEILHRLLTAYRDREFGEARLYFEGAFGSVSITELLESEWTPEKERFDDPDAYDEGSIGREIYLDQYAVSKVDFETWCNGRSIPRPAFWFGDSPKGKSKSKNNSPKKKAGRKKGQGKIDDTEWTINMHSMIENKGMSIWAAAGEFMDQAEGAGTPESKRSRLERNYKEEYPSI